MVIAARISGVGGCPNAPFFSRRDAPVSSSWQETASKGMLLNRIPMAIVAADGGVLGIVEAHDRDDDEGVGAFYQKRSTDSGASVGQATEIYRDATYSFPAGGDGEYVSSFCPGGPVTGTLGTDVLVGIFVKTVIASSVRTVTQHRAYSLNHGQSWSASADISSSLVILSTKYTGSATWTAGVATITSHGMATGFKVRVNGSDYRITVAGDVVTLTGGSGVNGAFTYTALSQRHYPTNRAHKVRSGAKAGWLLFGSCHRYSPDTSGISFSNVIGYDPSTDTWSVVGTLDETQAANEGTNECDIGEWADGTLVMFCRNLSADNIKYSTSTNQGTTWADALLADGNSGRPNLPGNSCNLSVKSLDNGTTYLAWCKETVGTTRSGLTLAKFSANSVTISNQRTAFHQQAGYPSLTAIDQSTLGLLHERTHNTAAYGSSVEDIGWIRVPVGWVDDGSSLGAVTNPVYPDAVDFYLNEASSGAPDSAGLQIWGQGYDQRGSGQASCSAAYNANGLIFDGNNAHAPPIITSHLASRTIEPFTQPGLGSLVVECQIKSGGSQAGRWILDSCNGATSLTNGWHIKFAASTGLVTVYIQCGAVGGMTFVQTSPRIDTDTSNWHRITFCYVRGGDCALYIDGNLEAHANDTQNPTTGICRGSTNLVIGRTATTATNALLANTEVRNIRIIKGQIYTGSAPSTLPAGGLPLDKPKVSKAAYAGATVTTPPATAPSSTNRLLWIGETYTQGLSLSTDYYGSYTNPSLIAYDLPKIPFVSGQGIGSLLDVTGGRIYKGITDGTDDPNDETFASQYVKRDSIVGPFYRLPQYSPSGQTARFQQAAIDAALDAPQNTGQFTVMGLFRVFKLNGSPGTNQLIDNCARANTTPGWSWWYDANNKVNFVLSTGTAGTVWFSGVLYNTALVPTDWNFLAVTGDATQLQFWYAHVIGPGPYVLNGPFTIAYAHTTTGTYASTGKPTLGSCTDQTGACGLDFRDLMMYSAKNDAAIAAAAQYLALPRLSGTVRYGYGYGFGY